MKAPISWLRSLVELPHGVTTQQLADAFTRTGLQVEHIELMGNQVTGPVVVGRVVSFVEEPQKNGKTIRWCHVDCGEQFNITDENPDVTDGRGIICGADNFAQGDYVVVALPGAELPGGFKISSRRTYGHVSDGMICAADELGIGEDHTGIIVLPANEASRAGLGSEAMALLGVPDEILDIDVTPDMSYCLSMRGLSREAAQAFDVPYNDIYSRRVPEPSQGAYPVRVESDDCELFVDLVVHDINALAPTPTWMRHRLEASGMRSISLPVDITNYVMLESGQPLHAYDADQLLGPIVVRKAHQGERLTTLDSVDRELSAEDLLITDDSGPIGLAGVMGGLNTELSDSTRNVVIEAAHFSPGTIGRTYRLHKLPSEASKRFERDTDIGVCCAAARMAARLLVELAGGTIADGATVVGRVPQMPGQSIDIGLPARILGARIEPDQVLSIFKGSDIEVTRRGERLSLVPPTWRTDLVDPYDYVEEVGRKLSLEVVNAVVPRAEAGQGLTAVQKSRRAVLNAIAEAGFVEVVTLPFVGTDDIDRLGLPAQADQHRLVKLANPLSDAQPYVRTTLLPGLFAAINRNTSRGMDDVALFEQGSVFLGGELPPAPMPDVSHRPSDAEIDALLNSLPDQPHMLSAVLAGNWLPARWNGPAEPVDWTHAVLFAQTAADAVGLRLIRSQAEIMPWHPGRCAELSIRNSDGDLVSLGAAGELHPRVIEACGLPARSCAVEINLDVLLANAPTGGEVHELSPYPLTKEDVALIVDDTVAAADVEEVLRTGAGPLLESIALFDIYSGEQTGQGKKSLAFSLRFGSPERTLTQSEAAQARDNALAAAVSELGAQARQA